MWETLLLSPSVIGFLDCGPRVERHGSHHLPSFSDGPPFFCLCKYCRLPCNLGCLMCLSLYRKKPVKEPETAAAINNLGSKLGLVCSLLGNVFCELVYTLEISKTFLFFCSHLGLILFCGRGKLKFL